MPASGREPNAAMPSHRRRPSRLVRRAGLAAAILAAVALAGVVAFVVLLNSLRPDIAQGDLYALNRPASLSFLDEKDQPAGLRGAVLGQRLSLGEMPPYLPEAFIAAEDRHFYQHHGIDPEGMLRAAIVNFKAGHVVEGGSTITQQLVKMLFLTPDRTMSRKLRELAGALALEHRLSKQQILQLYLNRLYLGSGAYGVDAAAHVYFGKSARDVTVAQAAMLASLTRAPSAFSPRRDLGAAQDRAAEVLDEMVDIGAITPNQAKLAEAHPAVVTATNDDLARNYFLDAAADEAKQLVPSAQGDLVISTTLDPSLESAARAQLTGMLDRRGRALHATQGALVAMTTEGAIRALIGGRDYAESSFNRVTSAHRQPGSAFKAFVYLAALEQGLTPATIRNDQPVSIPDMDKAWTPDNYSQTYVGPVTLEQAFAKSINTIAVQLGQEAGIPTVVAVAHRLGIESPLDPVPSLALGTSDVTPLEMTAAYGAFATLGHRVQPYMVREIRSSDGTVLYRRPAASSPRVIAENTAREMNDLLYQVVQEGTGHAAAVPGHEVAGKTGTSADYRDAWFIGFSPELVTGVWVGNDDSSPMKQVTGGLLPAQIWGGFMKIALQNRPATPLPRSEPVGEMPLVAQMPNDDQNAAQPQNQPGPFDGLGRFFGGLFGDLPGVAQPANPPPQRSAQGNSGFFSNRRPDTAAPTPNNNVNTNSDGGNTGSDTANGNSGGESIIGNSGADRQQSQPDYTVPHVDRRNRPSSPPPVQPGQYAGPGYGVPPDNSGSAGRSNYVAAPENGGYAGNGYGYYPPPHYAPPAYAMPPPDYYRPRRYFPPPPPNMPPPTPNVPPQPVDPPAYGGGSLGQDLQPASGEDTGAPPPSPSLGLDRPDSDKPQTAPDTQPDGSGGTGPGGF